MKRIFFIIIIFIILLLISIFTTKDFIAKQVIIKQVKQKTGLNLSIDKVRVGLLNTSIDLENLKIENPEGFSNKKMAKIPLLFVDYDLLSLLKNRIHLKNLKFHLEEVLIESNQAGIFNIEAIKPSGTKKGKKIIEEFKLGSRNRKEKGSHKNLKIDKMHLIINRIIYSQISSGREKRKILNINLDKKFKNITSIQQLRNLIIAQVTTTVTLDKIKNIGLGNIKDKLKKQQDIKEQLKNLEDIANDIIENLPF